MQIILKVIQKNYYLLYWICDNQRFELCKNLNLVYLIFNKVNGYLKEINRNEYIMLIPTTENKEKIKKNMMNFGVKSEI